MICKTSILIILIAIMLISGSALKFHQDKGRSHQQVEDDSGQSSSQQNSSDEDGSEQTSSNEDGSDEDGYDEDDQYHHYESASEDGSEKFQVDQAIPDDVRQKLNELLKDKPELLKALQDDTLTYDQQSELINIVIQNDETRKSIVDHIVHDQPSMSWLAEADAQSQKDFLNQSVKMMRGQHNIEDQVNLLLENQQSRKALIDTMISQSPELQFVSQLSPQKQKKFIKTMMQGYQDPTKSENAITDLLNDPDIGPHLRDAWSKQDQDEAHLKALKTAQRYHNAASKAVKHQAALV